MLLFPVLNAFGYKYFYDSMFLKKYSGLSNNRTDNMTLLLGGGTALVGKYAEPFLI